MPRLTSSGPSSTPYPRIASADIRAMNDEELKAFVLKLRGLREVAAEKRTASRAAKPKVERDAEDSSKWED